MVYADYAYYSGVYMGMMEEGQFQRLAIRASSYLDYYTRGRAQAAAETDAVKMCCCALADEYAVVDSAEELARRRTLDAATGAAEIKSETVGEYSRTMATGGESAAAALAVSVEAKKMLAGICREYLAHTGLLYRGGCC